MHELGVIHGRFQLLHNDHLTYLLEGKKRCRHLVVGITNPEPDLTADDASDPNRSRPEANPFSYFERYRMVEAAMLDAQVSPDRFSIVPFPINYPERYRFYVPLDAVFFLSIYDGWGEKKLTIFREMGLKTEIIRRCSWQEKGLSSTAIRNLIQSGEEWEHLVPGQVLPVIRHILSGRKR